MLGETFIQVDSGFATGGVIFRGGVCVNCAPIFKKYFLGKSESHVLLIIDFKDWTYKRLNKKPATE